MIRKLLLITALISISFAQDMEKVEIESVKVTDNIYMLVGMGGNIGLCVGDDGVFIIDDQFAPLTDKIKAAIAKITDKPVKFLVNTHYHFDHTGGNENFGKQETIIVAHKNVRKRLSAGQFMKDMGNQIPPAAPEALPVITFTQDIAFHQNGEDIQVEHVKHAHTDGDALIFFEKAKVVHMGDCFFNGLYPYFDIHAGGDIDGVIRVVGEVLGKVDDQTKIIPGHGPLANKQDLQKFHDMLVAVRAAVWKQVKAGKSLEETLAAGPTAQFDAGWGNGFLNPEKFTTLLYNDLVRKK